MKYRVPVTVMHPNGAYSILTGAVIDDADLDWFTDDAGDMRFDLDHAEDIAREMVLDELTFAFGKPEPVVVPYRALEGSEGGEDGQ